MKDNIVQFVLIEFEWIFQTDSIGAVKIAQIRTHTRAHTHSYIYVCPENDVKEQHKKCKCTAKSFQWKWWWMDVCKDKSMFVLLGKC
jgi:hypothetical protein